jgi:DNA helicase II / ATP-dependent DNA helicase PcrA
VGPSPKNRAVIAAAGSHKTQFILDEALIRHTGQRVLITTYTRENCEQITRRLLRAIGCIPPNVQVLSWFGLLMNQAARPYQSAITGRIDYGRSLNFKPNPNRYASKARPLGYYFDRNGDFYRDALADFVVEANQRTGGSVIRRLERIYDAIYIDELQDLAGYDLDFVDSLFGSALQVTIVGDPRQPTYATNQSNRNKKYRGERIADWFRERARAKVCTLEERTESWRCNQAICDWGDDLYPHLPRTASRNGALTGHDEVVYLAREDVASYMEQFQPTVLRWSRTADTQGLPAMNVGVSKGSTFDRVLIFPPATIVKYLVSKDLAALKERARLYVAVTRAKHSVAFVVDRKYATYSPLGMEALQLP